MNRFAPVGRTAPFAQGLSTLAGAAQAGFLPTVPSGHTTGPADSIFLGPLSKARHIMIDGNGYGAAGSSNALDLDAIGAHEVTPNPEPATTAPMLAGPGAPGFIARRRQPR